MPQSEPSQDKPGSKRHRSGGAAVASLVLALVACSNPARSSNDHSLRRVADLGDIKSAIFLDEHYFVARTDGSGGDPPLRLYRADTGALVADLGRIRCGDRFECLVRVLPNGVDRLLTADRGGDHASLRRLSDGQVLKVFRWQQTAGVLFASAPDGASFVVGPRPYYSDGMHSNLIGEPELGGEPQPHGQALSLINSDDGSERANLGEILWARFSSDGTRLFTKNGDTFQIRDGRTGEILATVPDTGRVWFSDDESIAVFRSGRVVDARSGQQIAQLPSLTRIGDISPDGSFVAVQEARRQVQRSDADERRVHGAYTVEEFAFIWNVRTNSLVVEMPAAHYGMAFAANGTRLVSTDCGDEFFCQLSLWDSGTGERLVETSLAASDAYMYDGDRLLLRRPTSNSGLSQIVSRRLSDGEIEYVSDRSGRLNWEYFPDAGILTYTLGSSPSGVVAIVRNSPSTSECSVPLRGVRVSDRTAIWEYACAHEMRRVGEHYLLVASGDDSVTVLRVNDGQRVGSMQVEIDNAVISPDGVHVVAICTRRTQCENAGLWRMPSHVSPP